MMAKRRTMAQAIRSHGRKRTKTKELSPAERRQQVRERLAQEKLDKQRKIAVQYGPCLLGWYRSYVADSPQESARMGCGTAHEAEKILVQGTGAGMSDAQMWAMASSNLRDSFIERAKVHGASGNLADYHDSLVESLQDLRGQYKDVAAPELAVAIEAEVVRISKQIIVNDPRFCPTFFINSVEGVIEVVPTPVPPGTKLIKTYVDPVAGERGASIAQRIRESGGDEPEDDE